MLSRIVRRLHYWLNRRRYEAELAEEMAFHRSMTDGRSFGNAALAQEDARAVWIAPWIESVWRDAAYGLRTLRRERSFAVLAIVALAAGVGLNTTLFTPFTAFAMKPSARVRGAARGGHRPEYYALHPLHRIRDETLGRRTGRRSRRPCRQWRHHGSAQTRRRWPGRILAGRDRVFRPIGAWYHRVRNARPWR